MTSQELRNSILQLAIQGKLVEQRPEEGSGEELYQEIQAEKRRLIKAGKIKRGKSLPEITEDDIPFDIPENWKWVRIGQVFSLQAGKNITASDIHDAPSQMHSFLCYGGNGIRGYVASNNRSGHFALIGRQGALCGNINYANGDFYATEHAVVVDHFQICDVLWSGYFLAALDLNRYATATAQPGLAVNNIVKILIPLPPLAEQKRIVARIEELLPYIDRYEQAWSKLEEFNKRFPDDMQKSLLQYAIQGKLVEQRPEEGTGEELYVKLCLERNGLVTQKKFRGKKHPKLPEEELPFDIPDTWKWVRLGDIISIESGKGLTAAQMAGGSIPVYGGNGITGYHNESLIQEETVVIGRVGFYCGSVHLTEQKSWVTDNAFITTYPQDSIDRKFLVYMLRHMNLGRDNNATAQPVVSGKKIYPLAFPLPPLAEQKRIVAKLEEILPLCEKLKK
jgi:type I restriction enzyme S subunit